MTEGCPEFMIECNLLGNLADYLLNRNVTQDMLFHKFTWSDIDICYVGGVYPQACFVDKPFTQPIYFSVYIREIYGSEDYQLADIHPICSRCEYEDNKCSCDPYFNGLFKVDCVKEVYEAFSLLSDAFRILSLHKCYASYYCELPRSNLEFFEYTLLECLFI